MLHYLFAALDDRFGFLNVFSYITSRTGGAILTAFAFGLFFGPKIISLLKMKQGRGQLFFIGSQKNIFHTSF